MRNYTFLCYLYFRKENQVTPVNYFLLYSLYLPDYIFIFSINKKLSTLLRYE